LNSSVKRIASLLFVLPLFVLSFCSSNQESENVRVDSAIQEKSIVDSVKAKKEFSIDSLDYLLGKFNPGKNQVFTEVSLIHGSRKGMYLRKDVYEAFKKMFNAAKIDRIDLKIISATRTFRQQKAIWEAKWEGKKLVGGKDLSKIQDETERAEIILKYSSMPGTSRHHWGTDMDLNDLTNDYFEYGTGAKIYQWLQQNAGTYGFCQPYTSKDSLRPNGYEEEKWHWSYFPVSSKLLTTYLQNITVDQISGFQGSEKAEEIGIIEKYVAGVNQECK